MIPKTIHYCWFGRSPLPVSAKKCIDSWRKFFPDYEIKEWNEDNFNVNTIQYTHDAYKAGKYAFVSDYARFWILYHHGGVYFDTDVEVIRPMDDILGKGAFMGFEIDNVRAKDSLPVVAPGLGIASEKNDAFYEEVLKQFEQIDFLLPDGTRNPFSMIPMVTKLLKERGMKQHDEIQTIAGITIYPNDFFNPFDDITGILRKTPNTRSIHWYSKTWADNNKPWLIALKRLTHRIFGTKSTSIIRKLLKGND